ncbi:MAG TPA: zf-HC2 domain-containing protein [Candidatus Cybelea sp.]|jgi:hypothetical protein|nr:zf-HC2 domain-containing protein [Candidatus Cybelea sp.]
MEPKAHIGENAELYAVGTLDARERAAVETHVSECSECRRRLGEAEETVLALERDVRVDPLAFAVAAPLRLHRREVPAWWLPVAAAAALIVGMALPSLFAQRESPTLAMIHSHFNHAQFSGSNAPPAKVIYARDRSWYYVIVEGSHRYGVYGVGNGRSVEIGSTQPKGESSELFVRDGLPFDRVELRDGVRVIEAAMIR